MRLLKTLPNGTKVYRNAEWDEYVVKPRGTANDDAKWHFCDDKQDAFDEAEYCEKFYIYIPRSLTERKPCRPKHSATNCAT